MYIIVGLGNPGAKYMGTRHNIGFDIVDELGENNGIKIDKRNFKALIGEGNIVGEKVMLMMPQTYMNLSGESVKRAVDWFKIETDNIIVVYDDISLPPGKIRIREKGSAGGHNGIKSIIKMLGTENFKRIRVGVGEKPENWDLADHVLGKFSDEENKEMIKSTEKAHKALECILKEGINVAMNKYN